jgi:uncharacterized protein YeaO (DUF488 family)
MIRIKRVYEPSSASDGQRILIDRLWPRGLTKRKAAVDIWMKELAPSTKLRRWFGHDPAKWPEYKRRYRRELRAQAAALRDLADLASRRRITLVYGARDELHNDAVVLAALLRTRMKRRRSNA